jgi:hypothetical protein
MEIVFNIVIGKRFEVGVELVWHRANRFLRISVRVR